MSPGAAPQHAAVPTGPGYQALAAVRPDRDGPGTPQHRGLLRVTDDSRPGRVPCSFAFSNHINLMSVKLKMFIMTAIRIACSTF